MNAQPNPRAVNSARAAAAISPARTVPPSSAAKIACTGCTASHVRSCSSLTEAARVSSSAASVRLPRQGVGEVHAQQPGVGTRLGVVQDGPQPVDGLVEPAREQGGPGPDHAHVGGSDGVAESFGESFGLVGTRQRSRRH